MSASRFEAFLAHIYVDESARARFLADPRGEAIKAGLTEQEVKAVESIDRVGLDLLAKSLERKRLGGGR
jgi:phosphoribosylformylglycinamidine (FGAM) synthase PurS component